jgi:signal transduction histidine kinase
MNQLNIISNSFFNYSLQLNNGFNTNVKLEYLSFLIISIGSIILLGWLLNNEQMIHFLSGIITMKANTAFCFIISGLLFYSLIKKKIKLANLLSLFLILYGAITLGQYIFKINFGIDELLSMDNWAIYNNSLYPGRPASTTVFCFLLYGIAGLTISNTVFKKIGVSILKFILIIAFIIFTCFIIELSAYQIDPFNVSMALNTSITFIILSLGTLVNYSGLGKINFNSENKIGNEIFKILFLRGVTAFILLGFIRFYLHNNNIISNKLGIILFAISSVITTFFLLKFAANHLNFLEVQRDRAENNVNNVNKNLENIVIKRTESLIIQNKQLEEFAFIISHNFRSPVSNIKSLIEFYEEEDTIENKDFLVDKMKHSLNNLNSSLDELLQVVIIKNDLKKQKENLNFNTIFNTILHSYLVKIEELNAIVTTDFTSVPTIEYSSVYLKSIIENLFNNTLKYSSPDRRPIIHLETKSDNGKIYLSVSDNGLGIDLEENRNLVFGFHKVFHDHPDAKGVGLYLTKAQIVAMGGDITVESQVNVGSVFTVIF